MAAKSLSAIRQGGLVPETVMRLGGPRSKEAFAEMKAAL